MKQKCDEFVCKKRKCEENDTETFSNKGTSGPIRSHNWRRNKLSSKSTLEVLTDNLREIDLRQTSVERMEGDVPQLCVKNVFVGNVRIGWPYPSE